jgi:glycosidase
VQLGDARYPSLYQINTRVYLRELANTLGRTATLDDVPDAELDRIASLGFDWVWLLGVWQTGAASRAVSRSPERRREFERILPDLVEDDIVGSCFAITGYTVHTALGGDEALARLRERMRQRDLRLMLDFVPNHTALDHPWVVTHPDYYVQGTEEALAREPQNYQRVGLEGADGRSTATDGSGDLRSNGGQSIILAHGRDPYFPGWADTYQLNYSNPKLSEAMCTELLKVAGQCDGVRCDMGMLLLPDVFQRTWGISMAPFWPESIEQVRARFPDFTFLAEVYWDLEWTLQQQGFDYTYDKRLYDRLREQHADAVRGHLQAAPDFQDRSARFLENHDEPRAAATFPLDVHRAAAVATFFTPGLRFFHQGQLEGRRVFLPVHLGRAPAEPVDSEVQAFYTRLLACLRNSTVRDGAWRELECTAAWEDNWTSVCFLACAWEGTDGSRFVIAINYAPNQAQCFVQLPFGDLLGGSFHLIDRMGSAFYGRPGDDLAARGLYLDLPPWGYHAFEFVRA